MSVRVSYKKQFLLAIVLLLIVLVVVEGLSRIYLSYFLTCYFTESDTYAHLDDDQKKQMCIDYHYLIRYRIPYRHHHPDQHFETYNINSEGFRGPEISKEKPDDTFRIFVIGGSTVFGGGNTSDNGTIPGYLQQNFDDKNLDFNVEVVNAGQNGISSWGQTKTINNKLVNYNPDLIIIYNAWNDLVKPYPLIKDGITATSSFDEFVDKLRVNISFYKTFIVAYKILDPSEKKVLENLKQFDTGHISEKVSIWKNRMKETCELGNTSGFDTIIFIQPHLDPKRKPLTDYERKYAESIDVETISSSYQLYANELDVLRTFCKNTTDLRGVFDVISEPLYYDAIHVGDKGNEIIAEKIFEITLPIVEQSQNS